MNDVAIDEEAVVGMAWAVDPEPQCLAAPILGTMVLYLALATTMSSLAQAVEAFLAKASRDLSLAIALPPPHLSPHRVARHPLHQNRLRHVGQLMELSNNRKRFLAATDPDRGFLDATDPERRFLDATVSCMKSK
jgi:hypothetical protein